MVVARWRNVWKGGEKQGKKLLHWASVESHCGRKEELVC